MPRRPNSKAARAGAALIALAALGAAAPSATTVLAGRYHERIPNALVSGEEFWSTDTLQIVPVDAGHAYFELMLNFYNGHSCSMAGVATAHGAALDYTTAEFSDPGEPPCHLTLRRDGKVIRMDDHQGTCKSTCGARGGYSDASLPWASRRPIANLARLKRSDAWRDAITEWKKR